MTKLGPKCQSPALAQKWPQHDSDSEVVQRRCIVYGYQDKSKSEACYPIMDSIFLLFQKAVEDFKYVFSVPPILAYQMIDPRALHSSR
jgi:hypothetical protein